MIRLALALLLFAACAAAPPIKIVVVAEPWLQHESQLLQQTTQRYVRDYVQNAAPLTVSIQLERSVFDVEHASLVATYVITDASGRTIGKQTLRISSHEAQAFRDAGSTIAKSVAAVQR